MLADSTNEDRSSAGSLGSKIKKEGSDKALSFKDILLQKAAAKSLVLTKAGTPAPKMNPSTKGSPGNANGSAAKAKAQSAASIPKPIGADDPFPAPKSNCYYSK